MGPRTIFLDMDGVVADFVSAAIRLNTDTPPDKIIEKMRGSYDIEHALGIPPKEFWERISHDNHFWWQLELTPEAHDIVKLASDKVGSKNVYFLSSPSLCPWSHWGKASWIKEHFPTFMTRTILCNDKQLLARPASLLIDDSDAKVDKFRHSAGKAILLPRPWNSLFSYSNAPLDHLRKELNRA